MHPMTDLTPTDVKARLKALGLFGLIACCDEIIDKPWLRDVLDIEERERQKRGLERRKRHARVGATKPMADFDWSWQRRSTAKQSRSFSAFPSSKQATTPSLSDPTAWAKR